MVVDEGMHPEHYHPTSVAAVRELGFVQKKEKNRDLDPFSPHRPTWQDLPEHTRAWWDAASAAVRRVSATNLRQRVDLAQLTKYTAEAEAAQLAAKSIKAGKQPAATGEGAAAAAREAAAAAARRGAAAVVIPRAPPEGPVPANILQAWVDGLCNKRVIGTCTHPACKYSHDVPFVSPSTHAT